MMLEMAGRTPPQQTVLIGGLLTPAPRREYNGLRGVGVEYRGPFSIAFSIKSYDDIWMRCL